MKAFARTLVNVTAGTFDRAVVAAVRRAQGRGAERPWKRDERLAMLAALRRSYGEAIPAGEADALLFPPPPPTELSLRSIRRTNYGASVADAEWPSSYRPLLNEVSERYLAARANQTAHARLFLHSTPRPAIMLVHGYLGGHYRFEEFAFPLPWLYRIGFDVALFVLPFHARRAAPGRGGAPPFPGSDPRFTIEGFRQATGDLRALLGWLQRRGSPSVGVMGMSLGGYTSALTATIEPTLSFSVPVIPLACLADFARDSGRLGSSPGSSVEHEALSAVYQPISPLARPGLLPKGRMLVVAAQGDAITPMRHAERLAAHFEAPLISFAGGHLMQLGVREAWRKVKAFWRGLDLID